ncbi:hypothetical protein [Amycolatopsis ultiminotia]|uniref:hypothetical protein n=1 Tax=Amycolatopsis ultiminotia TaxID=543629 RepID=UPI0031EDAD67
MIEAYGHEVVATVTTGPETLDALVKPKPDVSIVDIRMPPTQSDEGLPAVLAQLDSRRAVQPGHQPAALPRRKRDQQVHPSLVGKLGITDDDNNNRVLAVLTYPDKPS